MPGIDLSIALTNPVTLDAFNVTRRPDTPNNFGESSVVPTTFSNVRGVVCQASPSDMRRLPEEERQLQAISIITRFALRGASNDGGQDYQPDLVTWAGSNYIVKHIQPYARYGAGFVQVIATLTDSAPAPPVTGVNAQSGLPLPVPGGFAKHFPLEPFDGVRRSFTFPGLPLDQTKYLLFYNGASQGGFMQLGNVITLDFAPTVDPVNPNELYTYGY